MPVQVEEKTTYDATLCAKDAEELINAIDSEITSAKHNKKFNDTYIYNKLKKMMKSCNFDTPKNKDVEVDLWKEIMRLKNMIVDKKPIYTKDMITGKVESIRPNEMLLDVFNEIRYHALVSIEHKGKLD